MCVANGGELRAFLWSGARLASSTPSFSMRNRLVPNPRTGHLCPSRAYFTAIGVCHRNSSSGNHRPDGRSREARLGPPGCRTFSPSPAALLEPIRMTLWLRPAAIPVAGVGLHRQPRVGLPASPALATGLSLGLGPTRGHSDRLLLRRYHSPHGIENKIPGYTKDYHLEEFRKQWKASSARRRQPWASIL